VTVACVLGDGGRAVEARTIRRGRERVVEWVGGLAANRSGEPRPVGRGCDIGSPESQNTCPVDSDGGGPLDRSGILAFSTPLSSNDDRRSPIADRR
jgi:hypothetical protein